MELAELSLATGRKPSASRFSKAWGWGWGSLPCRFRVDSTPQSRSRDNSSLRAKPLLLFKLQPLEGVISWGVALEWPRGRRRAPQATRRLFPGAAAGLPELLGGPAAGTQLRRGDPAVLSPRSGRQSHGRLLLGAPGLPVRVRHAAHRAHPQP